MQLVREFVSKVVVFIPTFNPAQAVTNPWNSCTSRRNSLRLSNVSPVAVYGNLPLNAIKCITIPNENISAFVERIRLLRIPEVSILLKDNNDL